MKIRRNIYIVIGSLLVVINLLVDMQHFSEHYQRYEKMSSKLAYFIGSNFILIFGLIFFGMAYRLNKKIKSNKRKSMEQLIENIGKD